MELNRVLVVDDDPATRRIVCALLDLDEYGLLEAPTAWPPWSWSGSMTSDRPYRRALPFARACQEIVEGAGSQFDPRVVEVFAAIAPDLPDLHASLHASPSLG